MTPEQQKPQTVAFGWGAPKLKEQSMLQQLSASDLYHFQLDADAISRLHSRGIIPHSQGQKTYDRLAVRIGKALQDTLRSAAQQAEAQEA